LRDQAAATAAIALVGGVLVLGSHGMQPDFWVWLVAVGMIMFGNRGRQQHFRCALVMVAYSERWLFSGIYQYFFLAHARRMWGSAISTEFHCQHHPKVIPQHAQGVSWEWLIK